MQSTNTPPLPPGNSNFATSLGMLMLRLVLGWVFVYHGAQKLFGAFDSPIDMPGFTKAIEGMGLPLLPPAVWAYMAAMGEFGGGILLMVGFLTRFATLPILGTMFVAIWKAHGPIGFSNPKVGSAAGQFPGYEFNLALVAMAVALLLAGPGIVSLDALIFRRGLWARGPQPLDQPAKRS